MNKEQKIIVKVKKVKTDGAHGGAWKIAYADFVTAMMAFFLLLWLLNTTEQEVLEGISNYFTPTIRATPSTSGSGGLFAGITSNEPGPTEDKKHTAALNRIEGIKGDISSIADKTGQSPEESTGDIGKIDDEREAASFNTSKKLLEQAIDQLPPEFDDFKQSILVDITEDGLQIQLVDQSKKENFQFGSAKMTKRAQLMIRFISQYISPLPNNISITGHTASDGEGKNKWRLSIQRANTTRRELLKWNFTPQRINTVIGKADTQLLRKAYPKAPQNRRMAIVLLHKDKTGNQEQNNPEPPSILK